MFAVTYPMINWIFSLLLYAYLRKENEKGGRNDWFFVLFEVTQTRQYNNALV